MSSICSSVAIFRDSEPIVIQEMSLFSLRSFHATNQFTTCPSLRYHEPSNEAASSHSSSKTNQLTVDNHILNDGDDDDNDIEVVEIMDNINDN